MNEWVGGWMDGHLKLMGTLIFSIHLRQHRFAIFAVLHSLDAAVEQGFLLTQELSCSALWDGKSNKLQTNMLIFDVQRIHTYN